MKKTAIIKGASGAIGEGLVQGFLKQGFNVIGTSRNSSRSLTASSTLILVDGDIGQQETAAKIVEAACRSTNRGGKCVGFNDDKGGVNSISRSLAIEYAKDGVRFNAFAPGAVATAQSPMGTILEIDDVVGAVLYLAHADQVTGEVLHVDGGAHAGSW